MRDASYSNAPPTKCTAIQPCSISDSGADLQRQGSTASCPAPARRRSSKTLLQPRASPTQDLPHHDNLIRSKSSRSDHTWCQYQPLHSAAGLGLRRARFPPAGALVSFNRAAAAGGAGFASVLAVPAYPCSLCVFVPCSAQSTRISNRRAAPACHSSPSRRIPTLSMLKSWFQ